MLVRWMWFESLVNSKPRGQEVTRPPTATGAVNYSSQFSLRAEPKNVTDVCMLYYLGGQGSQRFLWYARSAMIRAIIFDLDGTLVQSEKLKAQAYAIAVQRLRGLPEPDPRAIEAYRTIVGSSREVATQFVIDQVDLEPDLRPLMAESGASEPHQVLTKIRTGIYDEIVVDPQVLRDNQWSHTVGLLRLAKETGCHRAGNDVVPTMRRTMSCVP